MLAVYSQTIKRYLIHTTASYHVFCNEHTFQRVCEFHCQILKGTTNCSSVDLCYRETQKSCKTVGSQVVAPLLGKLVAVLSFSGQLDRDDPQ
jgi:hypothetical protein